jgi:hypothetical protein
MEVEMVRRAGTAVPLVLRTISIASLALLMGACDPDEKTPTMPTGTTTSTVPPGMPPPGTRLVREQLTGSISAATSTACSQIFRDSVHPNYFSGGTGRCVEFARRSATAGVITARLTWDDRRIDLDTVLNNGAGMNFRQSIAANRCCETIEFFVNAGTDYVFVIYLRGVDAQFLANGGTYTGEVATPFRLEIERPE